MIRVRLDFIAKLDSNLDFNFRRSFELIVGFLLAGAVHITKGQDRGF